MSQNHSPLFIKQLGNRLEGTLPGRDAHAQMAPSHTRELINQGYQKADARESAVLILLYYQAGEWKFPLIVRNEYPGVHSGQVSLPGGKKEESDPDLACTALRETQEEIGVNRHSVSLVGKLTPFYVHPSNFIIFPFVGYSPVLPVFEPDRKEVQQILQLKLNQISSPEKVVLQSFTTAAGARFDAPGHWVEGHFLWGATAMILNELAEIVKGLGPEIM